MLPPSLIGLALASDGSVLEPSGIGSIRYRGSFWQLLTGVIPIGLRYQNLAKQTHNKVLGNAIVWRNLMTQRKQLDSGESQSTVAQKY